MQYQPGKMDAPVVLAKGYDEVAQKIKAIAAEQNIGRGRAMHVNVSPTPSCNV